MTNDQAQAKTANDILDEHSKIWHHGNGNRIVLYDEATEAMQAYASQRTAGLEEENKRKDETIKILDIKLVEKHVEIQGLEEERDRLLKRIEELESLLQIERLNHQKDHGFGF